MFFDLTKLTLKTRKVKADINTSVFLSRSDHKTTADSN